MDELVGLSEEARKLAMERFCLLQPHVEQNEPLKSVAQAAGIPYRTAYYGLVSEYRRHGLAALVRKKRADRGERRGVSDKLKDAIGGLALQKPPLPIAALYRQVLKLSQDREENNFVLQHSSATRKLRKRLACRFVAQMPTCAIAAFQQRGSGITFW
jgi:hypothetical protein